MARKRKAHSENLVDRFDGFPIVQEATHYCQEIVAENIPAGQWVRLACERQLRDLTRKRGFGYRFDPEEAERVTNFLELFPHVKGDLSGQPLLGASWQRFIDTTVFGWLDKETFYRRFHEVYECIPRKNGKSAKAGPRGLYMLTADGEAGAEVFAGNISEKEANKIWRPAWYMAKRSPEFRKEFGVDVLANSIVTAFDGGKFDKLIGNPGDGDSPSCVLIDEYHQHPSDTIYETMKTGAGSRRNWLIWIYTTAGNTIGGPCFEYQQDMQAILAGAVKDEEKFAYIAGIDEGDDWKDPAALYKANPNIGVSVDEGFLLRRQQEAITTPRQVNGFKAKHLNIWTSARSAYISPINWRRCQNSQLRLEDFHGEQCLSILDLAAKNDVAAYMKLFFKVVKGKLHYYTFGRYYLPEEAVHEDINRKYLKWDEQGLLQVHDGAEVDYSLIRADVEADLDLFDVMECVYDPWRASQLAQELARSSVEVVEYRNKTQNMSEPMKELGAAIDNKRFHHDGDPVLTWMAGNVTAREDANGNVFPRKEGERRMNKIDGIVGLIMGVGRLMYRDDLGDVGEFIENMIVA